MAKLKFGSFEVKAEMPEVKAPVIPNIDVKALVDKAIASLPKMETVPVNLEPLNDMVNDHALMLMELHDRLAAIENEPVIELPEVKNITHVQDVSSTVVKECKKMILDISLKHEVSLAALKSQLHTQKHVNLALIFSFMLTLLLHLL